MFDRLLASRIVVTAGSAALIAALAAGAAPAQASTQHAAGRQRVSGTQHAAVHHVRVGTTASTARASATPDFTCPSRTFCLFQDANLTGYHFSFTTDVYNGKWLSVTEAPFNFSLPWGSLHNNSGSSEYFWDAQTKTEYCVTANDSGTPTGAAAGMVHARYLYIEYGIGTCQYPTPPS